MPDVVKLAAKVHHLSSIGLIGVIITAHWLRRCVIPLKKQVHPAWEYSGPSDPTREVPEEISGAALERCLREMFHDHSTWVVPESMTIFDLAPPRSQVN